MILPFPYTKIGAKKGEIYFGASRTVISYNTPTMPTSGATSISGIFTPSSDPLKNWNPILIDFQTKLNVPANAWLLWQDAYFWVAFPKSNPSYPDYLYTESNGGFGTFRPYDIEFNKGTNLVHEGIGYTFFITKDLKTATNFRFQTTE